MVLLKYRIFYFSVFSCVWHPIQWFLRMKYSKDSLIRFEFLIPTWNASQQLSLQREIECLWLPGTLLKWKKLPDDDDDDDDELILENGWPTKGVEPYVPAGAILKDFHQSKTLKKRQKQGLNLCRTWVQAFLNEVVQ